MYHCLIDRNLLYILANACSDYTNYMLHCYNIHNLRCHRVKNDVNMKVNFLVITANVGSLFEDVSSKVFHNFCFCFIEFEFFVSEVLK